MLKDEESKVENTKGNTIKANVDKKIGFYLKIISIYDKLNLGNTDHFLLFILNKCI